MTRRSIIGGLIAEQLAAANSPVGDSEKPAPRVAAGPVRTMGLTLDKLELERKSLHSALAAGASVIEIDAAAIEASFAADRFQGGEGAAFEALKRSIAESGQEVPILVRPLPGAPGRYQAAYGHRRLRACAELGRPVKAIVRALTDAELVVAQGLENASRVDLSFIEKAAFARDLEDRGFDRPTIMAALSIDKTEVSKMIATARAAPVEIVRAVGSAPKAGRRRWMRLADLLAEPERRARVAALIGASDFAAMDSDARFAKALDAASRSPAEAARRAPHRLDIKLPAGAVLATATETDGRLDLSIDRTRHQAFADFLVRELADLYRRFEAGESPPRPGRR